MLDEKLNLEPFRAKNSKSVYKLNIILMENGKKEVEVKETIDAFPGKIGLKYAQNILFRVGNEIVKNTLLEYASWKDVKLEDVYDIRDMAYKKEGIDGTCLLALLKWQNVK